MSIESIRKSLHFMLEMETGARDLYKDYLKRFTNHDIVADLKHIERQEEAHMIMAKRLVEILGANDR